MSSASMTSSEKLATASLATLFSLRMLGLFMILPVFALYGDRLAGSNATLIGVAIGAYGLTQAMLQVPFGMLSDRIGRKNVIYIGLTIFALGSFVAAMADTIYGVIFGRALQGAGAIASAVMALLGDVTREEHRTKAMAFLGVSIGLSFSVALVIGPIMTEFFGLSGLFGLTGVLALVGIGVCYGLVPTPVTAVFHRDTKAVAGQFMKVISHRELMRLNIGILVLHMLLTACFVVLPLVLAESLKVPAKEHWHVYLPILIGSFVAMIPLMILAEAKRMIKQVFVLAISMLIFGLVAMAYNVDHFWAMCAALFIFFMAFNLLEAMLPSLVSKLAPAGFKGTSMGVYSTAQFFGAFLGGVIGGYFYGEYGLPMVFTVCAVLAVLWLMLAVTMAQPKFLQSYMLNLHNISERDAPAMIEKLMQVPGVAEAVVIVDEDAAYLKVDKKVFNQEQLQQVLS